MTHDESVDGGYVPSSQFGCAGGCGRTASDIADSVRWYAYAAFALLLILLTFGVALNACS